MPELKVDSSIYKDFRFIRHKLSLVLRKPVFGVSELVRHKPGCAVTEDGERLEILYLGRRGIVLSM